MSINLSAIVKSRKTFKRQDGHIAPYPTPRLEHVTKNVT